MTDCRETKKKDSNKTTESQGMGDAFLSTLLALPQFQRFKPFQHAKKPNKTLLLL